MNIAKQLKDKPVKTQKLINQILNKEKMNFLIHNNTPTVHESETEEEEEDDDDNEFSTFDLDVLNLDTPSLNRKQNAREENNSILRGVFESTNNNNNIDTDNQANNADPEVYYNDEDLFLFDERNNAFQFEDADIIPHHDTNDEFYHDVFFGKTKSKTKTKRVYRKYYYATK